MSEDKELTPWQKYKQNLGETRPWDLLNPNTEYVSDKEASRRYAICRECPFFISITTQCKKCGCLMIGKTRIAKAECPEHKW
jgi:hypothetical protein